MQMVHIWPGSYRYVCPTSFSAKPFSSTLVRTLLAGRITFVLLVASYIALLEREGLNGDLVQNSESPGDEGSLQ